MLLHSCSHCLVCSLIDPPMSFGVTYFYCFSILFSFPTSLTMFFLSYVSLSLASLAPIISAHHLHPVAGAHLIPSWPLSPDARNKHAVAPPASSQLDSKSTTLNLYSWKYPPANPVVACHFVHATRVLPSRFDMVHPPAHCFSTHALMLMHPPTIVYHASLACCDCLPHCRYRYSLPFPSPCNTAHCTYPPIIFAATAWLACHAFYGTSTRPPNHRPLLHWHTTIIHQPLHTTHK